MADALAEVEQVLQQGESELAGVADADALEQWRIKYLGTKGRVNDLMELLAAAPKEQKKVLGKPITVVTADHQNKADVAASITRKWFDTEGVDAITDVAGVKVGHTTLISGDGPLKPGLGPVRTGVTVIIPRDDVWHKKVPAGSFVLNGTGEMTGLAWVSESGFLEYPIALTNTLNVPRVANGVMTWMIDQHPEIGITDDTLTPVVAECDDGRQQNHLANWQTFARRRSHG